MAPPASTSSFFELALRAKNALVASGFGAGIVAMAIMPAAFEMMDAVPIVTVLWLLVTLLLQLLGQRD